MNCYKNFSDRSTPRLVIILIDNELYMYNDYVEGKCKYSVAVDILNELFRVTVPHDSLGAYYMVISYTDTLKLLYQGYLCDIPHFENLENWDAMSEKTFCWETLFQIVGDWYNIDVQESKFRLNTYGTNENPYGINDYCSKELTDCFPAPLIINITGQELEICTRSKNRDDVLNDIKTIGVKDGHPLLLNIHISSNTDIKNNIFEKTASEFPKSYANTTDAKMYFQEQEKMYLRITSSAEVDGIMNVFLKGCETFGDLVYWPYRGTFGNWEHRRPYNSTQYESNFSEHFLPINELPKEVQASLYFDVYGIEYIENPHNLTTSNYLRYIQRGQTGVLYCPYISSGNYVCKTHILIPAIYAYIERHSSGFTAYNSRFIFEYDLIGRLLESHLNIPDNDISNTTPSSSQSCFSRPPLAFSKSEIKTDFHNDENDMEDLFDDF